MIYPPHASYDRKFRQTLKCFRRVAFMGKTRCTTLSTAHSPLQNILWLAGERLTRAALTVTVLGVVARHLEPSGFGRLNFALSAVAIAGALATFGLEGLVVGALVKSPGEEGRVLGTAFRLRLIAGLLASALVTLMSAALPAFREDAVLVGIVSLGLWLQPADVIDLWFQRQLQSRRTVIVRLVAVAIGAGIKLGLAVSGARLTAFAWAQVIEAACFAGALMFTYRRNSRLSAWVWDGEIAREFWRRGAPLAVAGIVVALSLRLDQLLVRAWLGEQTAGAYFAATRLTEIALFAGTATTLSLFPPLAAAHAKSPAAFAERLQPMFDALSALGWITAIAFTALGPAAITTLYGHDYAAAIPALAWQGWGCLFALSAGARWQFILLAAPTGLNLAAALSSLLTQIVLAGWLIPAHGATGAAMAWTVAAIVSGYVTSFLFPGLRPVVGAQTKGLLIPFAPARWRAMLRAFSA